MGLTQRREERKGEEVRVTPGFLWDCVAVTGWKRELEERWPEWQACIDGYRGHYGAWARLPSRGLDPVYWPHVRSRICTRRRDTWRSLKRALVRTARALGKK